jgi:hypothetical protein
MFDTYKIEMMPLHTTPKGVHGLDVEGKKEQHQEGQGIVPVRYGTH